MPAPTDLIETSKDKGLAHLKLNSPGTGNALDLALIGALGAAISELDDTSTRAVLISAAGRNFSVGGDLNGMDKSADMAGTLREMASAFHDALKSLDAMNAPVVTAVNGTAAGGGLSLAIAGDIVIGASSSSYLMAYSAIGLSPDGGASYRLPRLIGLRATQEMAYLNRKLEALEALEMGLITRISQDEELEAEALSLARKLAEGPTLGFGRIKRLLSDGATCNLTSQLDREAASIAASAATHDAREGVAAFLARRRPDFVGR